MAVTAMLDPYTPSIDFLLCTDIEPKRFIGKYHTKIRAYRSATITHSYIILWKINRRNTLKCLIWTVYVYNWCPQMMATWQRKLLALFDSMAKEHWTQWDITHHSAHRWIMVFNCVYKHIEAHPKWLPICKQMTFKIYPVQCQFLDFD